MNRLAIFKTVRNALVAPAPYVDRYDRVDPKLLPLMAARYV